MPALPQAADRGRDEGTIEIERKPGPEHRGKSDRHVGVAAEIAIDLNREADNGEPRGQCARGQILRIDRRNHGRQLVREHQLLDEPEREDRQRRRKSAQRRGGGILELRNEFIRTNDGARDQVREIEDVGQDSRRPVLRRKGFAVDIDEVGDEREADEGYAERQRPRSTGRRGFPKTDRTRRDRRNPYT